MSAISDEIRELVECHKRKKELDALLAELKTRMDELEPVVLNQMQQSGLNNLNVDGVTAYLHRQIWAGAEDGRREALIDALSANEATAFLVEETCNTNRLSSWVREQIPDGEDDPVLPPFLKEVLKVTEKFSVRMRKG